MLPESYRLSVIWSRLCPVNLPRISRVCCWSCWPGPESVLRMGSRLAKCRVIEGTVKNGAAVRGVMQVFALLVPGGFFLSFFPCFYYCVFLLFIWCCGWLFSLSQWSVFGKQWLLTKKRNTATVVFPLPLGMWLSEKSAVMFMSKCQWCCSWVNVLAKRLTSGEFAYMFTLYVRCKSCWQNVWCAPVFYWECRRECALNILQVWETACVSPVSFAGVWGNRRSWPVSHLCVLQVFGATREVGCVLLRVFSLASFYPAPLFSANVSLIVRDKVNCEGQSHKTMCTDHNFWRERRAEADLNRGPSAYQHNALPLAQTSSLPLSFLCSFKYWPCCQTSKPGFVIGKLTPSQQAHKTGV